MVYILIFVAVQAGKWGFHMNFSSVDPAVRVPGITLLAYDQLSYLFFSRRLGLKKKIWLLLSLSLIYTVQLEPISSA